MTQDSQDAAYLRTLTVLYAEDDPCTQVEIAVFLRRRVGTVVTVASGAEGLAAFQAQPAHIVVTDIQMPGMSGLAMVEEIRKLDPSVPVIVTTAFEQTDYLMHAIELGVDRYVLKPIDGQRLEAALVLAAHRLLAEEQLRARQKLDAEAMRLRHQASLTVLLGGIAHDFNNLLQAILTSVSLAGLKVEPGSEANRILLSSEAISNQAGQLARRLLKLANPPKPLEWTGPVGAVLQETVLGTLEGSAVTAEFTFQDLEAWVRHNRSELAEVIGSLTQNALDAMPAGGTLRVATDLCEVVEQGPDGLAPGPYLRIRFQDTGAGIKEENLPMVFEPYFTSKPRGAQKGMGLGLAVGQAIARAHGGGITVASQPGEGAAFHLHLPVVTA